MLKLKKIFLLLFLSSSSFFISQGNKSKSTSAHVLLPAGITQSQEEGQYYNLLSLEKLNQSNAEKAKSYIPGQKIEKKHAPLMLFADPEQKENSDTSIEKLFFTLMLRDIVISEWSPVLLVQYSLFEQLVLHFHHHIFADIRKKYIFFEVPKSTFVLLVPHWYLLFYQEDHGLQTEYFLDKTHLLSYSTLKNQTNIFSWLQKKKEKLSVYDTLDELLINDLRSIFTSSLSTRATPEWDIWMLGHGEGKHAEEGHERRIVGLTKEYIQDVLSFFNTEIRAKSLFLFSSKVGGSNQRIISKALQKLKTPLQYSCFISDNYETDYILKTTLSLTTQNILQLIPAINVQSTILPSSFAVTIKEYFNYVTDQSKYRGALFKSLTQLNDILDGQVITPLEFDPVNQSFEYPPVDESFFVLGDRQAEKTPVETVVPEGKRVVFVNYSSISKLTIAPFSLHKKIDLPAVLQKLQLGAVYVNALEKNDQTSYQFVLNKVFDYAKNQYGYSSNQLQLLTMPFYETFQEDHYLFPKIVFTQTPKDLGTPQECYIKELVLKSSQPLLGGVHHCLCDAFTSSRFPFTRIVQIEKMTGFDDISNVVSIARTSDDFSHIFYTNRNRRTEIEKALEKQKKERKTDRITIERVTIKTEGNTNSVSFYLDDVEYQFEHTSSPFKITRFYQSENE